MLDKKTLRKLYYDQGLSDREISKRENVSITTICRWRKIHGIVGRKSGNPSWTITQLKRAVKANYAMSDTLRDLGLTIHGGNYRTIYKMINKLGLDTSHWIKHHKKGGNSNSKPLPEILVRDSDYANMSHLKMRLLREKLLKNICYECQCEPEWRDKPLSLHMDHINGINNDHRLDNLRLLCPNCHSQTPTYAGRNRKKSVE